MTHNARENKPTGAQEQPNETTDKWELIAQG